MKSISESVRGVAVVIASVMLAATIFTMPVKAVNPHNAVSPVWRDYESNIVGPFGYYVVDGYIATDNTSCLSCWVRDSYGSLWFWNGFCPKQKGEHVVLIMNSNGTPDKFSDDSIDDILWNKDEVD